MDLPLHPSVDIYQIHRTPFFRRLHRKDSDEFERLKQAYESVRNFDEKPLEAQVKKIRLGKLLRRIKDSFSNTKSSRLNKPRSRPKSKQQIRREELAKARQIGIDFSRRNLNPSFQSFNLQEKADPLDEWRKEKSRRERRLEYGNTKSQVNRSKIQRVQTFQSQRSAENENPVVQRPIEPNTTTATKKRLQLLQKTLTKEEFTKFLVHCLSADKPNPELMKSFEEILQSKNDLYWDLVEAIDQRQQYIKNYGKFMKKLSNLALKGVPETKVKKTKVEPETFVETFNSKTNIRPSRCWSPEVYIRTYRYSDEDEFLPPPSESLLRIPEDTQEPAVNQQVPENRESLQRMKTTNRRVLAPQNSNLVNKSSSHLSAKLINTLRTDPGAKKNLSHKFGEIIRDMVRRESAVMLNNLEKAMKN